MLSTICMAASQEKYALTMNNPKPTAGLPIIGSATLVDPANGIRAITRHQAEAALAAGGDIIIDGEKVIMIGAEGEIVYVKGKARPKLPQPVLRGSGVQEKVVCYGYGFNVNGEISFIQKTGNFLGQLIIKTEDSRRLPADEYSANLIHGMSGGPCFSGDKDGDGALVGISFAELNGKGYAYSASRIANDLALLKADSERMSKGYKTLAELPKVSSMKG